MTESQLRALRQVRDEAHGLYRGNAPRGFGVAVRTLLRCGYVRARTISAYLPEEFELTDKGRKALFDTTVLET